MNEIDKQIEQFVAKLRARLRELAIISRLQWYACIGLLIALIFSCVSLVISFYYATVFAAGTIVLAVFIGIISGIKRTPSKLRATLLADAKGHKEKMTTAYELIGQQDIFSLLQKKDAKRVMEGFDIRKEFPIKLKGKQVAIFIILAALFVISGFIDTPARTQAVATHEVDKLVEEKIAKLEKIEKKINDLPEISETDTKEIKAEIDEAKKELKEAKTKADVKKAEERLTKKMEMASKQTENKTLSETLSEEAKKSEEALTAEQEKLMEDALAAMEKAQKGSRKDKKDAAKKLQDLAQTLDDKELQKLADEYKASDYSDADYAAAESALNATVSNMSKQNSDLANNSSDSQNKNGSNDSTQSGNQSGNQSSSESQGNSGKQGQNGNGNGNGNGSGNGNGNGNGTGGNGNGSGSGGGAGWNKGSKDGSERAANTNENITVPEGETGNDDNLTGKANGNNSSTKQKSNQSKTWSGNKVSYGDVSGTYKDKAYKRVNGSNYPAKLKDKIKNYFDDLN